VKKLSRTKRFGTREKEKLFSLLSGFLSVNEQNLNTPIPEARNARISLRTKCPYCGSHKIKKNGTYRGRQRYLCKNERCGKSFNDRTGSLVSGTHHPEKWLKCLQYMAESRRLHEIADALDIHITTACKWRHKILNSLREIEKDGK
jgi:transposase-like protein